ncbi:MAG: hypothetical protein FJX72_21835, partial [Armatimonadetes bacterium]|nr:hypothetical protein [Armatimonadota bacterium]
MGPQHAVPYVEDPDLEYQLHRQLEAHPKTALVGVGGAGKTSLITHYAEHHAGLYPEGVFIIDATDGQAARRDLATRLQRLLNGPRMANLPREVIEVLRVRSGLAHLAEGQAAEWTAVLAAYFIERLDRGAGQYLLVFDNVASAGAMTGMFAGLVPDLSG